MRDNNGIVKIKHALIGISVVDTDVAVIASLHDNLNTLMRLRTKKRGSSL